jgi:hypothetical protein
MVGGPIAADHREADEEGDEVAAEVAERFGHVPDVVRVLQRRHRDADDEQSHRNRE